MFALTPRRAKLRKRMKKKFVCAKLEELRLHTSSSNNRVVDSNASESWCLVNE
jgi:hypothetical protein